MMKQKLLKPVITNEKLIAALAVIFAVVIFAFFRIFFYQGVLGNARQALLQMPEADNAAQTSERVPDVGSGKNAETRVPILLYRHIGPVAKDADPLQKDRTVSPENFELQVAWLKGQGYESINLSDLLAHFNSQKPLPQKAIVLTFNNGYQDTLAFAPPTLKKYGFTGDFGVITQFPGIAVGESAYASWQSLRQAKGEGMEIVSQTQDNFDGADKKYDNGFILRNLADSQKDLKANLGLSLPILIYPFGHYDARYLGLARQAGFSMGLTENSGSLIRADSLMEIPRLEVHGNDSLETFQKLIQTSDAK